ncbi:unnamed protein product [Calypogeia fissa]
MADSKGGGSGGGAGAGAAHHNNNSSNHAAPSSFVPSASSPLLKSISSPASLTRAAEDAAVEAAVYAAKYRIYEREYLRRINHKYFSGKNLAGTGRVFDTVTTVEGFLVKESREPPINRFLETPNSQEEQSSKSGGTPATKRHMTRKSQ